MWGGGPATPRGMGIPVADDEGPYGGIRPVDEDHRASECVIPRSILILFGFTGATGKLLTRFLIKKILNMLDGMQDLVYAVETAGIQQPSAITHLRIVGGEDRLDSGKQGRYNYYKGDDDVDDNFSEGLWEYGAEGAEDDVSDCIADYESGDGNCGDSGDGSDGGGSDSDSEGSEVELPTPLLMQLPALQHLDLRDNGMRARGMAVVLAPSLQLLPTLLHLHLGGNCLQAPGMYLLAPILQLFPALQHLDLRGNGIKARGMAVLAPSLKLLPFLRHLDLRGNDIRAQGMVVLASSLAFVTSLLRLNLDNNNLEDKGAEVLAASLAHLPAL